MAGPPCFIPPRTGPGPPLLRFGEWPVPGPEVALQVSEAEWGEVGADPLPDPPPACRSVLAPQAAELVPVVLSPDPPAREDPASGGLAPCLRSGCSSGEAKGELRGWGPGDFWKRKGSTLGSAPCSLEATTPGIGEQWWSRWGWSTLALSHVFGGSAHVWGVSALEEKPRESAEAMLGVQGGVLTWGGPCPGKG